MDLPRTTAAWLFVLAAAPGTALAQTPDMAPSRPLSFEDSATILTKASDVLSEADFGVRAAQDQADASKSLHLPIVSLDVQELQYQKTIDLSLAGLKSQAQGSANSALAGINAAGVPGVSGDSVSAVTSQVQAALPGIFSNIPDAVSLVTRQTLFHPTVSAVLPIYAGGAMSAAQRTAEAAVALAKAKQASTQDVLQLQLVKAYFGRVLAARVLMVARDTRDGFERHLEDSLKLEKAGQLSHARVLEAEVTRDTAQRAVDKAEGDDRTAADALASLVHSDTPIDPTTPLFVSTTPLGPVAPFIDAAESNHPQLREASAAVDAARQGVRIAHSQSLPSIYAFGEYNLDRRDELVTEPDWIIGVGVHYTLLSNVNRRKSESAAREKVYAAQAAERQARVDLRTNIDQAWTLVETSRRQFMALDSSIASATESLRVQETAFREGEATGAEVTDARNALGQVRTQRAAAAYEYDLALGALLLASGQTGKFIDYLHSADRRVSAP